MADGSLKFDTKVDTTGFEDGTSSLKTAMEKLTSVIERLSDNIVNAFNGAGKAAENVGNQAGQAAEKVDDIAEAAKKAQKETKSLEEQMAEISVQHYENGNSDTGEPEQPRAVELGGDYQEYGKEVEDFVNSYAENMGKAEQYTNEFKQEIETLSKALKDMEGRGLYFGDDEYDETYMKLAKVKQALADYKKEMLSPTPDAEIPVKFDMNSFEGQKQELKAKIEELEKQGVTLGNPEYDSNYAALQRVIQAEREYKKSLMEADQGQKMVDKSAKKMKSSLDKAGKSAKGSGKHMSLLGMLGRSILFSFVFKAISAVSTAVKEGFGNLAQYSNGVNTTLSSLTSSLLYLKNSFATAFAPVLDFVVPALNAMIDAIANVLAWIGQLLAALTGKGSFVKAKKTQEDYAKSLKKTGGAAKQAGKDAERSTASFDKLNLISEQGAGSGGGGTGGTDPSEMFETVDVDTKITSMVAGMKQALNDFYSWLATTFGPNLSKIWTDMQPNIENFKAILAGIWSDLGSLGAPLKTWFSADLVPFIQQTIDTIGFIVNGLFDSFNMVFADIWNLSVFPALQNFITSGLPMITQFATEVMATLMPLFTVVKDLFDRIWRDAVAPALALITQIWTDSIDTLYGVWQEYGHPIFEAIREAIRDTGEVLNDIWDKYIKPVFDTFMDVADRLWTNHIKPLMQHFLEFGAKLIQVALDIYNNMILPMVSWFADMLGPGISGALQVITEAFGALGAFISGIIDGILLVLNGILDFIHTGFTQGWDKAWSNVGDIFKGVFNGIIQIAENAINFVIDSLNKLSFDVPDWVPFAGGEHFGFSLDRVRLPRLATGTVVPPRAGEFAAILGDNNREAEIVSPVSAMKQAFKEAMAEMSGGEGGDIHLTVNLDGKVVYDDVVERNRMTKKQTGKNPLLV
ncbi:MULTISPECIES: hypothetical protein [Hungatella]|jgi:phage-related protein|uniref:hypothetical protein n=1 Tax=Hungatella TaxID=1649459 RepID=UPI0011DCF86D|nr:hypothetical protein [Hungatella hathewayi]DAS13099.1 MAG TPA: minor tail protein [Bacteriophage sp.]